MNVNGVQGHWREICQARGTLVGRAVLPGTMVVVVPAPSVCVGGRGAVAVGHTMGAAVVPGNASHAGQRELETGLRQKQHHQNEQQWPGRAVHETLRKAVSVESCTLTRETRISSAPFMQNCIGVHPGPRWRPVGAGTDITMENVVEGDPDQRRPERLCSGAAVVAAHCAQYLAKPVLRLRPQILGHAYWAPNTEAPGDFSTGIDSPVAMDSST